MYPVLLLNPFHIYSDHNFASGESYYLSDTHDNLVLPRIFYSLLIYFLCLVGFLTLLKEKKYKLAKRDISAIGYAGITLDHIQDTLYQF